MQETEERVDKEVERRLGEQFEVWEQEYKRKKIGEIKDVLEKEVRKDLEDMFEQRVEEEKLLM